MATAIQVHIILGATYMPAMTISESPKSTVPCQSYQAAKSKAENPNLEQKRKIQKTMILLGGMADKEVSVRHCM